MEKYVTDFLREYTLNEGLEKGRTEGRIEGRSWKDE